MLICFIEKNIKYRYINLNKYKMYKQFMDIDVLICEAKQIVIKNDRNYYDKYLKVVEEFCNENKILLGGQIGMDLLTDIQLNKDIYQYYLYTDNTFEMAKKLVNKLYNIEKNNSIFLETILTHKEFNIQINTRLIIKIFNLGIYKNVYLYDLIGPIDIKGYFSNLMVQVISGEVYLIDIYRKLYTPYADKIGGYKTYSYYRDIEKNVYTKTISGLESKIIGGYNSYDKQINITKHDITDIKNIIIKEIISGSDNIIVGDYAIIDANNELSENIKKTDDNKRLQMISNMNPNDVKLLIQKAIKNRLQSITNKNIIYINYDLNLPDDFRIVKYIFYISDNKQDNISIMDMFNSSLFELIPYKNIFLKLKNFGTYRVKIGNYYVLLRYKFIDLWSMKLILNLGTSDNEFIEKKIKEILNDIKIIQNNIKNTPPIELFQLDNYVGNYDDEYIAKKKITSDTKFKHKRIYPSIDK